MKIIVHLVKKNIVFPKEDYKKPIAIVGYNNAGKTNFLNALLFGITERHINKSTFTRDDFIMYLK